MIRFWVIQHDHNPIFRKRDGSWSTNELKAQRFREEDTALEVCVHVLNGKGRATLVAVHPSELSLEERLDYLEERVDLVEGHILAATGLTFEEAFARAETP